MAVRKRQLAFSIIELLVVIAIISILMAMYLPILGKAKQAAMKAAGAEAMRQGNIGRMADNVNIANPKKGPSGPAPTREQARAAYRQPMNTGKSTIYVTEVLYVLRTDAEFDAYWHTLVDPYADFDLEYDSNGNLLAQDGDGNVVPLSLRSDDYALASGSSWPVMWEFISSVGAECSSDAFGTNVMYSDSHVDYVRYPGGYPASRTVAVLSHIFLARS